MGEATNPGSHSSESPGNGVDEDCDGLDKVVAPTVWTEFDVTAGDLGERYWMLKGGNLTAFPCGAGTCLLGVEAQRDREAEPLPGYYLLSGPEAQQFWYAAVYLPPDELGIRKGLDLQACPHLLYGPCFQPLGNRHDDANTQLLTIDGVWEVSSEVERIVYHPFGLIDLPVPYGPSAGWNEATGHWASIFHPSENTFSLGTFTHTEPGAVDWAAVPTQQALSDYDNSCRRIGAADVNGDSETDLLCGRGGSPRMSYSWAVHLGPLGPDLDPANADITLDAVASPFLSVVGDLTGDGVDEIAFGVHHPEAEFGEALVIMDLRNKEGAVSLTEALATFFPASDHEAIDYPSIAAGDYDGDGVRDLIWTAPQIQEGVAEPILNAPPKGRVSFFRGPIAGTYRPEDADRIWLGPTWDDGFGTGLVVGEDWDGDGRADLMVGAGFSVWDHSYPGAIWITPLDLGGE